MARLSLGYKCSYGLVISAHIDCSSEARLASGCRPLDCDEAICTGWLALMEGDRVAVPRPGSRWSSPPHLTLSCTGFQIHLAEAYPELPPERPALGCLPGKGKASSGGGPEGQAFGAPDASKAWVNLAPHRRCPLTTLSQALMPCLHAQKP